MLNTNKIDLKWIKWFIGLADAELNLQTFPKKRIKDSIVNYSNITEQKRGLNTFTPVLDHGPSSLAKA
jgi:hypothetical protein